MLFEAQTLMAIEPRLAIFPGVAIALAVVGLNLLGDGLRDALDPRLRDWRGVIGASIIDTRRAASWMSAVEAKAVVLDNRP